MKKILVIDDDEMFRLMLKETLKAARYEVLEADNGKTGTRSVIMNSPDLVVTDLIMPEQEGIETIKEIKKINPLLPIIAVSGGMRGGSMDFLPIAEYLGASRVFKKPVDRKAFLQAVADLLASSDNK